jgi:hypothetical protein
MLPVRTNVRYAPPLAPDAPPHLYSITSSARARRAAGVIVYPLFNFAPKLYRWFLQDRMRKLYRRLRIIEEALQKELTAPQVVALQTDLENVSRTARILPKRNSDLFFPLRRHIDLTRTELATRLMEVRSLTAKEA